MKKILTISIAAYNVEKYLNKTLDSLILKNVDNLEVLIVNDGSKDGTLGIAQKYERDYPNIFKVVNKENGGYGSTINTGIDMAQGKYFKQLDGDDWYETKNLEKILKILKNANEDIIYTPYIAFRENNNSSQIIHNDIEKNSSNLDFYESIKFARPYLPMHSLMFKTKLLKENNIRILEHCFYTDVEYSVYPCVYANSIRVVDLPLYIYRIGREGQSISVSGKLKHYKDHLRVDNKMLELIQNKKDINENVMEYLKDYFASIFASCIGNYLMLLKPSKDNYNLIKEYDNKIYTTSVDIYEKMSRKSKMVKYIRKSNYVKYIVLYYLKKITRRY